VQSVPAAAPSGLAQLLTGAPRPVAVIAALPVALHLTVVDADAGTPPLLCLALPGAVRLPSALLLGGHVKGRIPAGWGLDLGTRGTVGGGRVALPGLAVPVARWWRVPRPTLAAQPRPGWLAPPPIDRELTVVAGRMVNSLQWNTRGNHRVDGRQEVTSPECSTVDGLGTQAAMLLGRGPGLTPLGDDILAGVLVTLRALGDHRAAAALARPVLAAAPAATTAVSAALLWHAARGECVPELAALFRALDAGHRAEVATARDSVLRLGHTSGAGLLNGVALTLDATQRAAHRQRSEECA
jgi:hypothetical protein